MPTPQEHVKKIPTPEERVKHWCTQRNNASQAKKRALKKGDSAKAAEEAQKMMKANEDSYRMTSV